MYLERRQLKRLLNAAYKGNPDHYDALILIFRHAMRVSELTGLPAKAIQDGRIVLHGIKKGTHSAQALHADCQRTAERAQSLIDAGKGEEKLFPYHRVTIYRWMQEYGKQAGIPVELCHPHILRHSAAQLVFADTHQIGPVRQLCRHRSLMSTLFYLDNADADKATEVMNRIQL